MTSSRGNWQGRSVLPGLYLRRQLAEQAGVSYDTVVRWQKEGILHPIEDEEEGSRGHYLFDDTALRIARRLAELEHHNLDVRLAIINTEIARGDFDNQ